MEIQRSIRSYFKNLHSTKLENLKEMDTFLNTYHLPKLNQYQISNLNSPITPSEKEAVKLSQPKILPDFQRRINAVIPQIILLTKMEKNIAQFISWYSSYPNTETTQILNEPISLMKINAKILKEKKKHFQKKKSKIIYHDQVTYIPEKQRWFHIYKVINVILQINKHKDKANRIISLDTGKAFDKN